MVFSGGRVRKIRIIKVHLNHIVVEIHEELDEFGDVDNRRGIDLVTEVQGLQKGFTAQGRIPKELSGRTWN